MKKTLNVSLLALLISTGLSPPNMHWTANTLPFHLTMRIL